MCRIDTQTIRVSISRRLRGEIGQIYRIMTFPASPWLRMLAFHTLQDLRARHNDVQPLPYRVGGQKFVVTLPSRLVISFFEPTLDKIAEALREMKRDPALRNLHGVYLVGGFSRCPLLREVVRAELEAPSCRVVQAHQPDLAIVKGAVMFAESAMLFNSRKARLTYGQRCTIAFDGTNPEHRRRRDAGEVTANDAGDKVVDKAFKAHIRIGDDVPANGALYQQRHVPLTLAQSQSSVQIYASFERYPRFIDEEGCFQVGEVVFDLDMTKKTLQQRAVRVELIFGGSELTVKILHQTEDREITDAVMALTRIPEPAAPTRSARGWRWRR